LRLLKEENEIAKLCGGWRERGLRIGFVPTMGALHAGHLKLVETAAERCDRVVVSMFVNPIQFGPEEDLCRYPRSLEKDCAAVETHGASAVFAPDTGTVYPAGFSTGVHVEGVSSGLCGAHRPGHFDGVATVCAALFGMVRPHTAVFGRKDAQQLAVIRRMVLDLRLGVEIIAVPIVREPDGLAMSSRNAYLSSEERKQAAAVHRGLETAGRLARSGEKDCSELRKAFSDAVGEMSLLRMQYVETVNPDTMERVDIVKDRVLLAAAVFAGRTRLIDNVLIEPEA